MLIEALHYLATLPLTSKPHRSFVARSISLWSRARRCRKAWAEHEANTKAAILDAAASLKSRRTAVVLGSGLLRDVPIEALARRFDTVVLVDLVHVASVRLWLMAKRFRNVRLIERDLSGYDDLKSGNTAEPLGFLRSVPYLDFVVSANLLSQIGRGVERRAESDGASADVAAKLIAAHIEGLRALPCKTCLVTDISYAAIDRAGKTLEEVDLLHGIAPPLPKASWTWPVAPLGEESRDYQMVHKVVATY